MREGFGAGERHGWMNNWCGTLGHIITGRAADRLLESPLPDQAGLVALPSFLWREAGMNLGRKDRARGGGKLLMPIRVVWSSGAVAVINEGDTVLYWEAEGSGIHQSGSLEVRLGSYGGGTLDITDADIPQHPVTVPATDRLSLEAELLGLSENGRHAWWHALASLEVYVDKAVRQAHRYVTLDAGIGTEEPPDSFRFLDEQAIVTATNRLLIGDLDDPGRPSSVVRLLHRSLEPGAFIKVDPEMFTQRAIRRDAQLEVRRVVGDPAQGSKIRRTARDLGATGLDDDAIDLVLAEYRIRHPADKMGRRRIKKALQVRPVEISSIDDISAPDEG